MKPGGALAWVGLGLLVAVTVAVVVLSAAPARAPFDPGSSEPDGYRAVALLLSRAGTEVSSASATGDGSLDASEGEAVVVPVADYLGTAELEQLRLSAANGATVVLGGSEGFSPLPRRDLVRAPVVVVPRGFCDIAELEPLEAIDDISGSVLRPVSDDESCFDDGGGSRIAREFVGAGSVITLSSPYLWANARLQPDKEEGGRALDNGASAVALLAASDSVTFIEAEPPPGVTADGTRSPVSLMPLPVKLAIVQAVGAFVLFAWWKSRRLGRPVSEKMPVEVAGSELIEAVGGLLRRSGSPMSAAVVLRGETRRELSSRIGVPAGPDPIALVAAVSARTGRDPDEVRRILIDGPVSTPSDLLALSRSLDDLHSEVLDVQPTA